MRQDQKHVPVPGAYRPAMQSAYWSPDGEFGRAKGEPLPHRPTLPAKLPPRPKRPGPMLRLRYGLRLVGRTFQRRGGDVDGMFG